MRRSEPSIGSIRRAVEARDSASLRALYADDAVLTIIDHDHPPNRPRTIAGAEAIGAFLDDVYSRDQAHSLEMGVAGATALAFVEGCLYGDGSRSVAASVAELGPRGIVRQTTVQAWDN